MRNQYEMLKELAMDQAKEVEDHKDRGMIYALLAIAESIHRNG